MLTEKQVKAIEKKIQPKKSTLRILEHQLVKDGYVYFTDLEFSGKHKTDQKDGLYPVDGNSIGLIEDDFPRIEFPDYHLELTFKTVDLKQAIKESIKKVSRDELRPHLCGLHFRAKDGKLFLVATNGHVLIEKVVPCSFGALPDDFAVTIPAKFGEIIRFVKQENISLKFDYDTYTGVMCIDNDLDFTAVFPFFIKDSKDHSYPNYERVIPFKEDLPYSFAFNVKPVIDFIEKNKKVFVPETQQLGISIQENSMELKIENVKDNVQVEETFPLLPVSEYDESKKVLLMPIRIAGTTRTSNFALNQRYLVETLKSNVDKTCVVLWRSNKNAFMLYNAK